MYLIYYFTIEMQNFYMIIKIRIKKSNLKNKYEIYKFLQIFTNCNYLIYYV